MDFPAYVPQAVRLYVAESLTGDPRKCGASLLFAMAEAQLARLVRAGVEAWRPDFIEAMAKLKRAEDYLNCIRRLALDARMKDVYLLLAGELSRDDEIVRFISCAASTLDDYSKYRDRVIEAKRLADDIATAAAKLGVALQRAENFNGLMWPEEFRCTQALLERAQLDRGDGQYVPPPAVGPIYIDKVDASRLLNPIERATFERFLEEYEAWVAAGRPEQPRETAFDPQNTRSVIDALAAAALAYEPAEAGVLHAALASRKGNATAEYLRAFNWVLGDVQRSPALIKAIAITATVVLNDPDHAVTPADVRSVIARKIIPARRAHVRARFGYLPE